MFFLVDDRAQDGKIYCNLFALPLREFMEMEIKREAAEFQF